MYNVYGHTGGWLESQQPIRLQIPGYIREASDVSRINQEYFSTEHIAILISKQNFLIYGFCYFLCIGYN